MEGICEVYKTTATSGEHYDVNSLHPFIMSKTEFPTGYPIFTESKVLDEYFGFCYAKVNSGNVKEKGLQPFRINGMLTTPLGDIIQKNRS